MNRENLGKKLVVGGLTLSRFAFSLLAINSAANGNLESTVGFLTASTVLEIIEPAFLKDRKLNTMGRIFSSTVADESLFLALWEGILLLNHAPLVASIPLLIYFPWVTVKKIQERVNENY